MSKAPASEVRTGTINAIAAYTMWGVAPIYFKLLAEVSSTEILIHRVVWSTLFLLVIIALARKGKVLVSIIKQPKIMLWLLLSACFLAINWFLFIWAINNDRILDASLGYFINPLLSVALGMIFLGERLRKWQKLAVILAIIGVGLQLFILGSLPIVSLALAGTFGIYGLLRKKFPVDSFVGLFVESLIMLPIALLYWGFFIETATTNMFANTTSLNVILVCAGIVTTAPLLCFTAAAKRLPLSAVGFFQYIGPSIMFLLATFYYQEALIPEKLLTFVFIWAALIIYTSDTFYAYRKKARDGM